MRVLSRQIEHIRLVLWGPKLRSYHIIGKCPHSTVQEISNFCIYSLGPTNPRFEGLEVYHRGETHIIEAQRSFVNSGAARMVRDKFFLYPGDFLRINMYCGVNPINIEVCYSIVNHYD